VRTLLGAGAALLVFAASSQAQGPRPGFGVGVSLNMTPTSGFALSGGQAFDARTGNIHLMFRAARAWRIEPMFGYARESQKATLSGNTQTATFNLWRVGVGFLYLLPRGSSFQAYVGPRLGLVHKYEKDEIRGPGFPTASATLTETDKFISAVFGGEYFLAQRFSLGGEAQITYTNFGDLNRKSVPPNPNPQPKRDGSSLETGGLIVVRWYP
jgi:hypothetical protein